MDKSSVTLMAAQGDKSLHANNVIITKIITKFTGIYFKSTEFKT